MLEQLSSEVQSRLRSGVAITSVSQGVEELVLNSIDAEATCVAIRVDMSCCKIQVVDNGRGISKDALEKIAERYTTSKCHSLQDLDERLQHFGYRGEALASMRDISSILEIESRSKQCNQSFTRIFQNGKPHPVSESKNHRPSHGTTITVHNLFSSLPVRRKALNESLELERVRQRIEAIALIHPNCSFSLRNDVTGTKVLQTHKSNSVLGAFTFLFGNGKARMMTQVSAESGSVKINGFIGKEGNHNKNMQFIFINDRLVLKTKIHRLINYQVLRSSITRRRGGGDGSPKFISTDKSGNPSRPTSERHGIYVISVTCPLADYDITYDPAKTLVEFKDWRTILATVRGMVDGFLIEHNLIVKADPKDDDDDDGSEYKDLEEALEADSQEDGSGDPGPIAALQRYAAGITTANSVNNLASETVSRPKDIKPDQIVEQLIAEKTEEENLKNRATEEVHNEESVEDIPGNSLNEAASGRPLSSNIFSDTESKSAAVHCGDLMSGKSPLAFMYKTSQESETSDSIDEVQESTPDNTQSGKDKGSPKSSCGSSVDIVSGSETPRPRVRDKTFISLDVSSDSSPDIISKVSKYSELSESELYTGGEDIEDPLIGLSLRSNSPTHHIEQREKGNSSCNASREDNTQLIPPVRRSVALRQKLQTRQLQNGGTNCGSSGSLVLQTSSMEDFKRSMNKSNQSQNSLQTATSPAKTVRDESVLVRPSRKPANKDIRQSDSLLSTTEDRPCPKSPLRTLAIMKQRRHSLRSQDCSSKQNPDTSIIYSDSLGDFKKKISQESRANVHKVSSVASCTATTVCPSNTDSKMPSSSQCNLQSTTSVDKLCGYVCSLDTFRNEIKRLESVKKSGSANPEKRNEKNKSELYKDEALQSQDNSGKNNLNTSIIYSDSLGDFKKKISHENQASVHKVSNSMMASELYRGEDQIEDPLIGLTLDSNSPTVPNKQREEKEGSTSSSCNVSIRNKDNTHQIPPVRRLAAPKQKIQAEQSQDEGTNRGSSGSLELQTSSLEDFKRSMNSLGTSTSEAGRDVSVQARPSRKPVNKDASQLDSTKDNPCPKSPQRSLAIMRQRRPSLKTQNSFSKQDISTSLVYSDSLGDFKKKISQENQASVHKVSDSMMASELYRGEDQIKDPLIGLTPESSSPTAPNRQREEKEGSTSSSCNVSIKNQDNTHQIPPVRRLAAPKQKVQAEQSQDEGTNRGSSGSLVLQTSSLEDFKRSISNQNQKSLVTTVRDESVQTRPSKKGHGWESCTVENRARHGLKSSSTENKPQMPPCNSSQSLKSLTNYDKKAVEQVKAGHVRCESTQLELSKTAKCDEVTKPHLLQGERTSSTGKHDNPQGQSVSHVVNHEDSSKITHPRGRYQSGPNTSQLETVNVRESTEKTANLSENSQLQRRHSDGGRNSHSRRVSETDRKRRCGEAVSTVGLPLAAKLSRLSRGETVTFSQPPQISRRDIGFSIIDQMLEDTQAALRKARTSGVHPDSKGTGESDNVTADISKQSCQKRKLSGFPTEHPSTSGMEYLSSSNAEALNRPKPILERNIEKTKLPNVNVQLDMSCPSTHSSEQEGTPKSLSEEPSSSHFRSPAVKEANECYKAKLYENPFPFSATPVIPSWKEKTGMLWSTSDDEEETPSSSVKDWDYSIKRQKVHLGEESIASSSSMQGQSQLEEWKRLQLQTSPVRCIPCTVVNEPAEKQNSSVSLEENNRGFDTALPVHTAPSECDADPVLQGQEDMGDVGNNKTENVQSEFVVENPTESSGGKNCNTDEHSSGLFTIQALDYSIEFESLHKMAIPNMELGSSQPGDSPLHGQDLGTNTPQPSTGQSSCTPRPVDPIVTVEHSQGFATLPVDATTESEASAERSQGFVGVHESQGYVTKDETQRFTPPPQQGIIDEESKDDREPKKTQTVCPLPSSEKAPEKDEDKKSPETHSQPKTAPVKSPEKTLFVGPSWICKLDPNTGRKVFINKITGHSSFSSPKASFDEDESRRPVIHIKNPVLPSGATPLLQAESSPLQARPRALRAAQAASASGEEEDGSHLSAALAGHLENQQQEEATEMGIKWRQGSVPPYGGQAHCVRSMLEEWDNPVFKNVEQCGVNVDARSSAKVASRVQQAIHPYKLDKDVLQTIKVLGQLDNKFIACLLDQPSSGGGGRQELLAVIDQHAAHERVRLERLTAEAYAEDGSCINRRDIDPAVIITLKEEEVRVACAYRSALQKKGISFKVDSTKRTAIRVHEVPACLVERDLGERRRRRAPIAVDTLETLIIEETEMLNSTHGAGATIPQTVFRALCSQACHGAIKFGDMLTKAECKDLVKQLSTCKLPFQCAHGRPSVMPILDLGHLKLHQTQEPKIKLWKLRQSWTNSPLM